MRNPNIIGDGKICKIKKDKNGLVKSGGHAGLKSRVLFPEEFIAICNVIEKMGKDKKDDLTNLQMCLLMGTRYEEARRIQANPNCYDKSGGFIEIKNKKVKVKEHKRYIRLSSKAKNIIPYFFNVDKRLPSMQAWDKKLKGYARLAGIGDEGISSRMMRKTYESWLMFYYPNQTMMILQSQGHLLATALEHYINTPFNEEDKRLMKEWVEGWV